LIRVAGGDQQTLSLTFEEVPSAVLAPPNGTPEQHKQSGLGAAFWSTAIGAVALGAGAGVTGFLALQASNDNQDQRKQFGVSASTVDDSNSRAKTLALTSDILSGAALICAGTAVVLLVTSPHHRDAAQVGLNIGPGSASFVGRF
jgi:uncharacterized protein HemX